MKFLKNKSIAHRGLYDNEKGVPENSLISFAKAAEKDIPIELDVQLINDGNIVVFHDFNLKRMTNVDKEIAECDLNYLSKLKLLKTNYRIPTLDEVLKLIDGKVPLLIEIKNNGFSTQLEKKLLEKLKQYKGEYAIESFNPATVFWFRLNAKNVCRGQLSSYFINDKMNSLKKCLLKNMFFNFITKPHFVSYNIENLPNRRVEKIRRKGISIFGWTAKSKQDYIKAQNYCDSIIFENIDIKEL